jgi:uncharacterized protein (DUF427 family)
VRLEECPKRVRVYLGAVPVADSRHVLTMFETGHLPVYYFPLSNVRAELFTESDHHTVCPFKGTASYYSAQVGDNLAENAAWTYPEPLEGAPPQLADRVAFYWAKMDAWYEEDEEVYVHPRDPHKRIDVLQSSRHVEVRIAGETVAETRRPVLLFETHLPTRYYLPKLDVRLDVLEPSETTSRCPYKGVASYYSVKVGGEVAPDIAWYYPHPTLECSKIENMVCFFNEKVEELYVDGELQQRPSTAWS